MNILTETTQQQLSINFAAEVAITAPLAAAELCSPALPSLLSNHKAQGPQTQA